MSTDNWCTPKWLADALGPFDLDPCSNHASHIQARTRCSLDLPAPFTDGLAIDWGTESVFVNGPYSDPLPWCRKLRDHRGPWVALWKNDSTTRWYATLMAANPTVAPFRKRLRFEGEKSMTANFASVLIYRRWEPSAELSEHLWLPRF